MKLTTMWAPPDINWVITPGVKKTLRIRVLTPLITDNYHGNPQLPSFLGVMTHILKALNLHFFMVKKPYLRIQVCPKKGIISTFLFFSDGIGTPKNPIPFEGGVDRILRVAHPVIYPQLSFFGACILHN